MKKTEIEIMLTPDCDFSASDELKERILNAAAQECSTQTIRAGFARWRTALSTCAAGIAVVAIMVFMLKPGSTPAFAAESFFANAAKVFSSSDGYAIDFEVRTIDYDNFSYTDPSKAFVKHKMYVCNDGRWRLDKTGRIAENDGGNVWVWLPKNRFGWKFDAARGEGVLEQFGALLDMSGLMAALDKYAAATPDAVLEKKENAESVTITIKVPAQGDFSDKYAIYSSVEESPTKQTYIFSKAGGMLLSAKIEAKVAGSHRTIMRLDGIEYNVKISDADMEIPSRMEWLDQTASGKAALRNDDIIREFQGISEEDAVSKLFASMNVWDENRLKVILDGYPLSQMEETYSGCTLLSIGSAFKSGQYPGYYVPCKIALKNGRQRKLKIAVRNDNPDNVWNVDGGL